MKKIGIIFGLICLVVFGFFAWFQLNLSPVNPTSHTQQTFVIPQGTSLREVANTLQSDHLIKNTFAFLLYMKSAGLDNKIQKGDFTLSSTMSAQLIGKALTSATMDIWVTIIPGKRAEEIADILQQKIPSYEDSWRAQLRLHEGYLFPDTYLIPREATIQQIISIMTNNFNAKYQQASQTGSSTLSQQQIVTLASIVEREAISYHDMQLVASVLENRLQIGMALGSDVTVEYALGYQPKEHTWWKKDLTVDDLNIDSAYNTRKFAGLPPTPICNPGSNALEAVFSAPKTNYLYYVSDSSGVLHFASTLQQHNANVQKYGE